MNSQPHQRENLTNSLEETAESKERSFYETATPEEWSRTFQEWSDSHLVDDTLPLSEEAISRESIYEERERRQI